MRNLAVLLVFATLAAGCGADDEDDAAPVTTATVAAGPSCDPEAFLPLLRKELEGAAEDLRIVEARVERCRNGYARVLAVPDPSVCEPGVGGCYETEQVFFRAEDGSWRILTYGTGLDCADADLDADLRAACEALGYR